MREGGPQRRPVGEVTWVEESKGEGRVACTAMAALGEEQVGEKTPLISCDVDHLNSWVSLSILLSSSPAGDSRHLPRQAGSVGLEGRCRLQGAGEQSNQCNVTKMSHCLPR